MEKWPTSVLLGHEIKSIDNAIMKSCEIISQSNIELWLNQTGYLCESAADKEYGRYVHMVIYSANTIQIHTLYIYIYIYTVDDLFITKYYCFLWL
jgi:hypothetical protein